MILTSSQFDTLLASNRGNSDPHYRSTWQALALGQLDRFHQKGGMSIGPFANLVDLPKSTVRYYVERELVAPFRVDGKFRFHPFNCWELRSVQQWQELGLSLDEIGRRRETIKKRFPGTIVLDVMGPLPFRGEEPCEMMLHLKRVPEGRGYRELVIVGWGDDTHEDDTFSFLLSELGAVHAGLQNRLELLQNKLTELQAKRRVLAT